MPNPNPRVPNLSNPICPECGKPTTCNMTLESGSKQYRCRRHKPNYTCTDSDRPQGRQPMGLSQVELNKRYRDRHRERYLAALKIRRARTRKALKLSKVEATE